MTDAAPLDFGFLSLPAEIQDACMAEPEPSGRIRIEIVADDLGRAVKVDYEADMAYFEVHPRGEWHRNKRIGTSIIGDYGVNGELIGVEVFLVKAAILPATVADLERLFRGES